MQLENKLKALQHYINLAIWTLAGLYLGIAILVNIPVVQHYIGEKVAAALARKLDTRVSIGRVDVGLFNRIIIDDVHLFDQRHHPMLMASRLSAKLSLIDLMQGRISVSSAQLFGLDARLYQANADANPNFQFVLDSLASKDTTRHTPLDLELKSVVIRHGSIAFDRLDLPRRNTFDTHHLHISKLSSHLILNKLQDDSVNLNIKRLSLHEASGIDLQKLSLRFLANTHRAELTHFNLNLPHSHVQIGRLTAAYRLDKKKLARGSLHFEGAIDESVIHPKDLEAFKPELAKFDRPIVLSTSFSGTDTQARISRLLVTVPRAGTQTVSSSPADIRIHLSGSVSHLRHQPQWQAAISQLMVDDEGVRLLAGSIPDVVSRLQHISYRGTASGRGKSIALRGTLLSGAGNADINAQFDGQNFAGYVATQGFNLRQVLQDKQFGQLATEIFLSGNIAKQYYQARGKIERMDYHGYAYRNADIDGTFDRGTLNGRFDIHDPNFQALINGTLDTDKHHPGAHLTASLRHLNPALLHLATGRHAHAAYSADIAAHFTGSNINTAQGHFDITHFSKVSGEGTYQLDSLTLYASNDKHGHHLSFRSDFAEADVTGRFNYATIAQSITNVIARKLPSIQLLTPIRYRPAPVNDFTLNATIRRSDWLNEFFGLPVTLNEPMKIYGNMAPGAENLETRIFAPAIVYEGSTYKDVTLNVSSPDHTLAADLSLTKLSANGTPMEYRVEASANNDKLSSAISVDNHAHRRLTGHLLSVTRFARNNEGRTEAIVDINPSTMSVGDSVFAVQPSRIVYSKNHLQVNDFAITGGGQHVRVNGKTSKGSRDSLIVDLSRVNVSYILDLVNFHAVDFSGYASGKAFVSHLFDKPEARGQIQVADFRFQEGRMGTLYAKVAYNRLLSQIDIDAEAIDSLTLPDKTILPRTTAIRGNVSPSRHDISLNITADHTRGDFVQSFCQSIMNRSNITADGSVRLWGDLSDLNLTGQLVANGSIGLAALNTDYTLHNDTIDLLVNEIQFRNCHITDRDGHAGRITGSLYHDHLSHLSYDIHAQADHLLAYDWGPTYGSTFYGTVYGTGNVDIKGQSGEVNIDVNLTPEKGSEVVYDVSSPTAVSDNQFIHWTSRDSMAAAHTALLPDTAQGQARPEQENAPDIPTDIRINFLINTTPDATLRLLMDKRTGDYITLNGSGMIRAAYYNKGGLDIFGNYVVDHGLYKLTIQNIIKRDFSFAQGSTIVFGGNPYNAALNLTAQYLLNSVSLSDLQIGRSFSNTNIKVNCIMNITGTPRSPRVDFSLDLPTVSNDAKQMIYSLINSEEEMNQQVLYLLAVGRFYAQGSNNANANGAGGDQTSLAMQSILSGQISQQLNTVLGSVIKDNNWNFGANISTGDEGWNNAEYEGLLSGRMLNNRLIFNGQFGYRDNNRATTSFIGDFDLQYLITSSGNLSVHVYNQTNDRYFTRNSLNTQGIGFILKRDFDTWKSLFRWRKKKSDSPQPPASAPKAAAAAKREK